jgi:Zn-dependent protease with chaperone function
MIGLATVAFGLIAAGAWNKFISDVIALFLKPGSGVIAELIYAVIITIVAILVVQSLAKLAEKEADLRARLPFVRKPEE